MNQQGSTRETEPENIMAKHWLVQFWWMARQKRECLHEGQLGTLRHMLELLSTDRVPSSSKKFNSAVMVFRPIESALPVCLE